MFAKKWKKWKKMEKKKTSSQRNFAQLNRVRILLFPARRIEHDASIHMFCLRTSRCRKYV